MSAHIVFKNVSIFSQLPWQKCWFCMGAVRKLTRVWTQCEQTFVIKLMILYGRCQEIEACVGTMWTEVWIRHWRSCCVPAGGHFATLPRRIHLFIRNVCLYCGPAGCNFVNNAVHMWYKYWFCVGGVAKNATWASSILRGKTSSYHKKHCVLLPQRMNSYENQAVFNVFELARWWRAGPCTTPPCARLCGGCARNVLDRNFLR